MRLARAHNTGGLEAELRRLARIPLLVIDEVGYIPFDTGAANLIFHLVASRYEHAATIVTSNRAFSRWNEIFGDEVVAAASDRRHHRRLPVTHVLSPDTLPGTGTWVTHRLQDMGDSSTARGA